ncbi:MAG: PAS domain-containing sensor histidine kinase, partial [Bacteroidia bacterium]|nr:PAS domain-containing sensor histidine kinase [Bacteroidia bacterium]
MRKIKNKKIISVVYAVVLLLLLAVGKLLYDSQDFWVSIQFIMTAGVLVFIFYVLSEKNIPEEVYSPLALRTKNQDTNIMWQTSVSETTDNFRSKIKINSLLPQSLEERYRQLEESNNQLKTLFENVQEAFFSVDMVNNCLLQLSPANKKIYDRNDKEFFDNINLWSDVIHPEDKYLVPGIFQNIAAGVPFSTEYRIIKRDGSVCWVENKITPTLDAENRPLRIDGVVSDISHRKQNEEQIKGQFNELQKTNYELDRFVYSVSHDLRAPLTSIMGIINLAELESQTEQQRHHFEMIHYSVHRLDAFIKHILAYSQNAKSEITIEPIDFKELLAETRNTMKHVKGTERMRIKISIDDAIPFRSDRMRLAIILNNLFSNAIKYQDINKNDSYLSVTITTSENEARITVEDNGIGIDKKHLNKIFKMFYRVSSIAPGSGLGL